MNPIFRGTTIRRLGWQVQIQCDNDNDAMAVFELLTSRDYETQQPKLVEGWVNVYGNSVGPMHETKHAADNVPAAQCRIRRIKVREVVE